MRLYGFDAINYFKAQGGKLNRFPNGSPGVKYDVSLEEAEQIAIDHPYSVWTELERM